MRPAIVELSDIRNGQQPRRNDRRALGRHAGLLLQRFLVDAQLDRSATRDNEKTSSERKALLLAAIAACRNDPVRTLYEAAYGRWASSFPEGGACRSEPLTTSGRLIVGFGSENVLETGLRLHHTYGTPIIPGSALKGLTAHYCHEVWGQLQNPSAPEENMLFRRGGKHHSLLFGTADDGGVVAFHDAWILPESLNAGALRLDVMTPHHPKWQTNEAPPTDFDSPVPVSFLSVAGTFDVRLSWCGPTSTPPEKAEAWTSLAMQLLREALAEWGIGGKTSSGYGRLMLTQSRYENHQSARAPSRLAKPSPGERVDAQLVEERTRRGGWRARHGPSGMIGPIQNSGDVPAGKKAGDTLQLIVANATDFRYPTLTDDARAQRAAGIGQRGRGKHGRGR